MWHYKLPTRQHARRTYTRCLLEECCSDNVYNYYYCRRRRRRWLRVSGGANFIGLVGTNFGVRADDFFSPHCCNVFIIYYNIYMYIGTYNQVIRDARKLISKKVILIPGPREG